MNDEEINQIIEHLEDNYRVLDKCNKALKEMNKIEEVLDEGE